MVKTLSSDLGVTINSLVNVCLSRRLNRRFLDVEGQLVFDVLGCLFMREER